jgi:histidine triad (HIT) family protein
MDCIFCKIIANEIPTDILYQDKELIAFRDINPMAPIHLLIIPRKHIPSLTQITEADSSLIGAIINVANEMARREGIANSGYRLVIICGQHGGQIIPHVHLHLLGGHQLSASIG